jgi:hypothetical protein
MENDVTLPQAEPAQASDTRTDEVSQVTEGEEKPAEVEQTPEQKRIAELEKEIQRKNRVIDKRTRRVYEYRAQLENLGLTQSRNQDNNRGTADDSETLSLTRAEFEAQSLARARELAPTLSRQAIEDERNAKVIQSLQKSVGGQEKFVEMTNELAEVFDAQKQLAVLGSDDPAALLKYLTDPDNADEAEEIGQLDAISAGRRLAKIEAKLTTPKAGPQASKAPPPLEAIQARGASNNGMPNPSNTRAWMAWRNEQERKGLA